LFFTGLDQVKLSLKAEEEKKSVDLISHLSLGVTTLTLYLMNEFLQDGNGVFGVFGDFECLASSVHAGVEGVFVRQLSQLWVLLVQRSVDD